MSVPTEPFFLLANQFESLLVQLNECPNTAERAGLLKRMKIVIDEVDALVSSNLNEQTPKI
jgi:hypothetical protein